MRLGKGFRWAKKKVQKLAAGSIVLAFAVALSSLPYPVWAVELEQGTGQESVSAEENEGTVENGKRERNESTAENRETEGNEKSEGISLGIDNRHIYSGMDQSFSNGYHPTVKDGVVSLTVPFTSSGRLKDDRLTITLIFAEKENSPFVFKNYQKDVVRKYYQLVNGTMVETSGGNTENPSDGTYAYLYTCQIPLQEDAAPGQYSVTLKASGFTETGKKEELECQMFILIPQTAVTEPQEDGENSSGDPTGGSADGGIPSGDPTGGFGSSYVPDTGNQQEEEIVHLPKFLLEKSNLTGQALKAGEDTELSVSFKNRSETQDAYNLKVVVSTESPSILFSQNSYYFSKIASGEEIRLDGVLSVAADTESGNISLKFDFEYEDKKGSAVSGSETLTVPIMQPVQMELELMEFPSLVYASDTLELPLKAMNLSRVGVYNVRIQLSGEGLFPKGDVFIGNMDAGSESGGTMRIYVGSRTMEAVGNDSGGTEQEKYGPVSGTVTLSYEDSLGETHDISKEYQTEIRKAELLSLEVKEEETEGNSWWISVFAVIIVGMGILVLLLLRRLRKKNMLLEEKQKLQKL